MKVETKKLEVKTEAKGKKNEKIVGTRSESKTYAQVVRGTSRDNSNNLKQAKSQEKVEGKHQAKQLQEISGKVSSKEKSSNASSRVSSKKRSSVTDMPKLSHEKMKNGMDRLKGYVETMQGPSTKINTIFDVGVFTHVKFEKSRK